MHRLEMQTPEKRGLSTVVSPTAQYPSCGAPMGQRAYLGRAGCHSFHNFGGGLLPSVVAPPGLEEDLLQPGLWDEEHGDRGTELLLPRPRSARERAALQALRAQLEAALATPAEWEAAQQLDDPYADEWRMVLTATQGAEQQARIADEVKRAFVPQAFVATWRGATRPGVCTPCGG